ncbi:leucine Rich repeat-containing domain protein, partial [Oesophagostomum dentatum]
MEEEDASGEEQPELDNAVVKAVPSAQVSPLPVAEHHDDVESQNDADDEDAPDTSQSVDPVDHDEQSSHSTSKAPSSASHNTSRVHSSPNDSLSRDDHTPPVCRNGVMDLSRRGLTNIDRKFRKEYGSVKKLIISMNKFHNVSGLDMFKSCVLVDAAGNHLHKLSSFLPLARQLKSLLLSNNEIKELDNLRSFVNLENLEVAHNGIERILSTLDNRRLSRLDLSSNALTSLPDLSKLTSLTNLDVSSNRISSFKHAVLPKSLLTLNVSYNDIDDLTEFMRLLHLEKLESLSLDNNPCVSSPTFNYRIYILSLLPSLQDIDNYVVTEEELLKGEWLYSQ